MNYAMTPNEQILRNLYHELNLMMLKHDEAEREYYESVAQLNLLNEKIIETKKLVAGEKA